MSLSIFPLVVMVTVMFSYYGYSGLVIMATVMFSYYDHNDV